MKKTLLALALSTALFSNEVTVDETKVNADIAELKAQMKKLDSEVKKLEATLPPNEDIITHTELGYVQTDGNTKTTAYNLDSKAEKKWSDHAVKLTLDAQFASDNDTEIKNKYLSELTYNYSVTKNFSFNYLAGYKVDNFSGFEYQHYTGPGMKYKALSTPIQTLEIDTSALYSTDKYEATLTPVAVAYKNSYSGYRVKGNYTWKITDGLKFDQEVSVRGSFEDSKNYFGYSKSGLSSKLSDIFSAGASYKVDYVNTPALGKRRADSTLSFNLIMDY